MNKLRLKRSKKHWVRGMVHKVAVTAKKLSEWDFLLINGIGREYGWSVPTYVCMKGLTIAVYHEMHTFTRGEQCRWQQLVLIECKIGSRRPFRELNCYILYFFLIVIDVICSFTDSVCSLHKEHWIVYHIHNRAPPHKQTNKITHTNIFSVYTLLDTIYLCKCSVFFFRFFN